MNRENREYIIGLILGFHEHLKNTWKSFTALKWVCCLIFSVLNALEPCLEADCLRATCKGCLLAFADEVFGLWLAGVCGTLVEIFFSLRSLITLWATDSGLFGLWFGLNWSDVVEEIEVDVIVEEIVVFEEVDFFLFTEFLFSSSLILMTFSTTLSNVVFFLAFFLGLRSLNLLFFLKALTATLTSRISSMPELEM